MEPLFNKLKELLLILKLLLLALSKLPFFPLFGGVIPFIKELFPHSEFSLWALF